MIDLDRVDLFDRAVEIQRYLRAVGFLVHADTGEGLGG